MLITFLFWYLNSASFPNKQGQAGFCNQASKSAILSTVFVQPFAIMFLCTTFFLIFIDPCFFNNQLQIFWLFQVLFSHTSFPHVQTIAIFVFSRVYSSRNFCLTLIKENCDNEINIRCLSTNKHHQKVLNFDWTKKSHQTILKLLIKAFN